MSDPRFEADTEITRLPTYVTFFLPGYVEWTMRRDRAFRKGKNYYR